MGKKSKRCKYSQFTFQTEPKTKKKNEEETLVSEGEQNSIATTSEENLNETGSHLCDVIKELCKRNHEWEKQYDTPFFIAPGWFQTIVKILGKDLSV